MLHSIKFRLNKLSMNVNMHVEKFVHVVYPGFICGTSATCVFCCICSVLNNVVDDCWRSHGQVYLVPTKAVIIVYKSYQILYLVS